VARYHLGNYEVAVQDCLQATRHLPNYALASLWLGKAWERLGNHTQARKAYQQAVEQAPDLKEAWFNLGVLAFQEGQLAQAQACLERAGDEVAEAARRAFYLGAIARSQGRLEQAQKAFAEAIRRDGGLLPAYLEEGKTLLELGSPKKAARVLTELIQRNPELPVARYYLALAQLAAWNSKGAWEQYFVLQKLDPALAHRLLPVLENER
jgi:tetratricopeptide (TPR) repeat protein